VSVPCRTKWTGSYTYSVNKGYGGPGGEPSSAGRPGSAGNPGTGGRPGSNFKCSSSSGVPGGSGPAGFSGAPNSPGKVGPVGPEGQNGTFTPSERSCSDDDEVCQSCYEQGFACYYGICWTPILVDTLGNGFDLTDASSLSERSQKSIS
jgi:hypothetical protein